MKKDRLYFFTFLAISIIFLVIATVSVRFFNKASTILLLDVQLESVQREAKSLAYLASRELKTGTQQEAVVSNIQNSIKDTKLNSGFLSVLDWSGEIICHPNRIFIGQKQNSEKSLATTLDGKISSEEFYTFLVERTSFREIKNNDTNVIASEIVYLYPVENSDLIIVANANLSYLEGRIENLETTFYTIFLIMGFVVVLFTVITVRLIGSIYEKNIETEKSNLEHELINLAKLNTALAEYQQKVEETTETIGDKESKADKIDEKVNDEKSKKRLLTYMRNELLSISITDIAYIYTENTITYVIDIHGKKSTSNTSLDELYSGLDSTFFYRANRQFIIAISSIKKIIRYGNNQLKIVVAPDSEVDIIIGKNKASEFKQWLNL